MASSSSKEAAEAATRTRRRRGLKKPRRRRGRGGEEEGSLVGREASKGGERGREANSARGRKEAAVGMPVTASAPSLYLFLSPPFFYRRCFSPGSTVLNLGLFKEATGVASRSKLGAPESSTSAAWTFELGAAVPCEHSLLFLGEATPPSSYFDGLAWPWDHHTYGAIHPSMIFFVPRGPLIRIEWISLNSAHVCSVSKYGIVFNQFLP